MATTYTYLDEGTGNGVSSATTSGNITPSANKLYLVLAFAHHASAVGSDPTCSGGGMSTWDNAKSFDFATSTAKLTVFRALEAAPGAAAPVTVTWGGSLDEVYIEVWEIDGIDTTGTNGSGAVKIANSDTDSGAGTSTAMTLAALTSPACDVLMFAAHESWFEAASPGAGMTGLRNSGAGGGGTYTVHVLNGTNVTSPSASWVTSASFGAMAIELVVAGAGGGTTINSSPSGTIFIDGTKTGSYSSSTVHNSSPSGVIQVCGNALVTYSRVYSSSPQGTLFIGGSASRSLTGGSTTINSSPDGTVILGGFANSRYSNGVAIFHPAIHGGWF